MCFPYVQVERRWAVGGVETVNRIKWMIGTLSVVVSSYMAPFSLGLLPLNILKLIIFRWFELISMIWNIGKYCVLMELQ